MYINKIADFFFISEYYLPFKKMAVRERFVHLLYNDDIYTNNSDRKVARPVFSCCLSAVEIVGGSASTV